MVPLIKVNVINKVKGLYGQQINQTDLTGVLSKNGQCNNRHVSKLFFTVAQLEGQSVKSQGRIGTYNSFLYYL